MNTIDLDFPVLVFPHPEVRQLTLRRPKVRDELEAKRNASDPAEIEVRLFAALTGQPLEIIRELDLTIDYPKLQEAMANFYVRPGGELSFTAAPETSASGASGLPVSASA